MKPFPIRSYLKDIRIFPHSIISGGDVYIAKIWLFGIKDFYHILSYRIRAYY